MENRHDLRHWLTARCKQIVSHIADSANCGAGSYQCDSLAALLALSTVSQSWRTLVLGPSCEGLWLAAIEKAGLPELEAPPPKVVQFANLAVGRQCKVRPDGCSSDFGAPRCSLCLCTDVPNILRSLRCVRTESDVKSNITFELAFAPSAGKKSTLCYLEAHKTGDQAKVIVPFCPGRGLDRLVYEGPDEPDPAFEDFFPGTKRYTPRSRKSLNSTSL